MDQVRHEARFAGLGDRVPTLDDVGRRRLELWTTTLVVVSSAVAILVWISTATHLPWLVELASPRTMRIALVVLSVGFLAYVFEKEVHLRRLERLLVEQWALARAYAQRAEELSALTEAARAVNAVLYLDQVLEVVLDQALARTGGAGGAVLLAEPAPEDGQPFVLRAAAARGGYRRAGEIVSTRASGTAQAASSHRPILDAGDEDAPALMAVPLVHRDRLLGVLEVVTAPGEQFSAGDLALLSVFADYAAVSIANARVYEAERARVEELRELDELKSQFLATVSHELKTPLTTIVGCATALRRDTLSPVDREAVLDALDRQAHRLVAMVEQLLAAGHAGEGSVPEGAVGDVAAVARAAAADLGLTGRPVTVSGPTCCPVRLPEGALVQVIWNLLDNAHKHGAPPVRVEIEPRGEEAWISVLDRGPGVPVALRERVFDRFYRARPGGAPGMGLGLAIVRQLVEAAGGRVWMEGPPGGGTAVRVTLPLVPTTGLAISPGPAHAEGEV